MVAADNEPYRLRQRGIAPCSSMATSARSMLSCLRCRRIFLGRQTQARDGRPVSQRYCPLWQRAGRAAWFLPRRPPPTTSTAKNGTRAVQQNSAPQWVMPATNELIVAIGRVVYNFAQLELSVERMRRVVAGRAACGPPTASWECFLAELEHAAADAPDGDELPPQLLRMSRHFVELRARRNALLGLAPQAPEPWAERPVARAAPDGRAAHAWPLDDILRTARDIEFAAIEINRLLRRILLH